MSAVCTFFQILFFIRILFLHFGCHDIRVRKYGLIVTVSQGDAIANGTSLDTSISV